MWDQARIAVSTTLTFRAGDRTRQCISVMLKSDEEDEPDEYLLFRANGEARGYASVQVIVNITISGAPVSGGGGEGGVVGLP